jgi:hypothetical protein
MSVSYVSTEFWLPANADAKGEILASFSLASEFLLLIFVKLIKLHHTLASSESRHFRRRESAPSSTRLLFEESSLPSSRRAGTSACASMR